MKGEISYDVRRLLAPTRAQFEESLRNAVEVWNRRVNDAPTTGGKENR